MQSTDCRPGPALSVSQDRLSGAWLGVSAHSGQQGSHVCPACQACPAAGDPLLSPVPPPSTEQDVPDEGPVSSLTLHESPEAAPLLTVAIPGNPTVGQAVKEIRKTQCRNYVSLKSWSPNRAVRQRDPVREKQPALKAKQGSQPHLKLENPFTQACQLGNYGHVCCPRDPLP